MNDQQGVTAGSESTAVRNMEVARVRSIPQLRW